MRIVPFAAALQVAAVILCASVGAGAAQTPPSAPAPAPAPAPAAPQISDAARKEAAALTDALGTQNSVQTFEKVLRDRLVALIVNSSGKPQEEVSSSVDTLLVPDLHSHSPELRAAVADIWASHFTLQEMKDLRAFYATPLGLKLIRAQGDIAQQTQVSGRNWAERYAKEAVDKNADQLRSRGLLK